MSRTLAAILNGMAERDALRTLVGRCSEGGHKGACCLHFDPAKAQAAADLMGETCCCCGTRYVHPLVNPVGHGPHAPKVRDASRWVPAHSAEAQP